MGRETRDDDFDRTYDLKSDLIDHEDAINDYAFSRVVNKGLCDQHELGSNYPPAGHGYPRR
ncbi:hypothetical protein [Streptomyces smyrnaeus]|uniref:hypothetical protein n=1 Tax=Streptomyces smyrnaeus TaxID=1387713 RepID=UPI0033E9F50D